jgi:D-serine dehydratase
MKKNQNTIAGLAKSNENISSQHKYPFIDQLVDTLHSNEINVKVQTESQTTAVTKEQIKDVMTQIIGDYDKRRTCLQMFEPYFRQFFNDTEKIEINGSKQLLLNESYNV